MISLRVWPFILWPLIRLGDPFIYSEGISTLIHIVSQVFQNHQSNLMDKTLPTWEFRSGLVVRILGFHCRGPGSIPGWGTENFLFCSTLVCIHSGGLYHIVLFLWLGNIFQYLVQHISPICSSFPKLS